MLSISLNVTLTHVYKYCIISEICNTESLENKMLLNLLSIE